MLRFQNLFSIRFLNKEYTAVPIHVLIKLIYWKMGLALLEQFENGDESIEVDSVLLAIGVVPNLNGVLGENCKPELSRGYLKVDENYLTSLDDVYAAGDIIGPPWLAHVATYRAIQAVNGMFEHSKPIPIHSFPGCTYCQPQVASMGLTEEKAQRKGYGL